MHKENIIRCPDYAVCAVVNDSGANSNGRGQIIASYQELGVITL